MKQVIIIGDTELGCGDLHDDFISDNLLAKTILKFAKMQGDVDLVLNGDTFDFIKASYLVNGKPTFPTQITVEIAMQKLKRSYKAHKKVFDALKQFTKNKKHRLYFLFGNHDPDLHFKEIQQQIKKWIPGKVLFQRVYANKHVHAEHGNEFDTVNKFGLMPRTKIWKGKKTLNLPLVTIGVIKVQPLKQEHPFLPRIIPIPLLFKLHPTIASKMRKISMKSFVETLFKNPAAIIQSTGLSLLRELGQRLVQSNYEVTTFINKFKDYIMNKKSTTTIHVIGHSHEKRIEKIGKQVFIHPDTWRDEYVLHKKKLYVKDKNYVHIKIDNDTVSWELVNVPQNRNILDFKKVIANEHLWIKKVYAEEN